MQSSNYLTISPRHTRPGNRKIREGQIVAAWQGLRIETETHEHLEIEMSDAELLELKEAIKKVLLAKAKTR